MRIIVVAVLACAVQSATAAEIPIPVTPAPIFVAPDPYPSRFLQQGIFFELGARYWFSSGKYSKDLFNQNPGAGLVSRLTYNGLTSNAGEFFGSVKSINGYFLKWNVGAGNTFGGELTDEDFPPGNVPLSRTTSAQRDGGLGYATIDLGYNVWGSPVLQVGPFVGVSFLRQTLNATGCVQNANDPGICVLDPTGLPVNGRVITQRADWTSIRVGVNADWNVTNQFKLSVNAAYLPYTKLEAQDSHLLRLLTVPEIGTGSGMQLEAIASYALSDSFSVGVGGRYWYMQAQGRAIFPQFQPEPLTTKAERYGVFLQGTYTFGLQDKSRKSPWLSCC
jgi:hypothetical protein